MSCEPNVAGVLYGHLVCMSCLHILFDCLATQILMFFDQIFLVYQWVSCMRVLWTCVWELSSLGVLQACLVNQTFKVSCMPILYACLVNPYCWTVLCVCLGNQGQCYLARMYGIHCDCDLLLANKLLLCIWYM